MHKQPPRLVRENQTIAVMVNLYCRSQHHSRELCPDCRRLIDYARKRLEKCPFQADKPTCAKCPVHCYQPEMRTRIRTVMRFSGPRMIYHHPILAIRHIMDGRIKSKVKSQNHNSKGKD